jgi:hypothetical protein
VKVPDNPRFDELLGLLLDEATTPEQEAELAALPDASPELSLELRQQLLMAAELEQSDDVLRQADVFVDMITMRIAAETGTEPFVVDLLRRVEEPAGGRAGGRGILALAVAVLLLLGLAILRQLAAPDVGPQLSTTKAQPLLQVIGVEGAFGVDGSRWTLGQTFDDGVLALQEGVAEVVTVLGVRLVLEAPVDLRIDPASPFQARLINGAVVATVPPRAIGFTIVTEEAEVVDLGTEFGVRRDTTGGTRVQVYEGEVLAGKQGGKANRRLLEGDGLRIRAESEQPETLSFVPD